MSTNQENTGQANFDNDEISINEIFNKLKKWLLFFKQKSKLILIITILGFVLGYMISFFEPEKYKATLTFAMEDEKGGAGGLGGALGIASSFGIDLGGAGGGAFAASNLSELMKSRQIVEKVLLMPIKINNRTTNLIDYYLEFNHIKEKFSKDPNLSKIDFSSYENRKNFSRIQDSIFFQIQKELISPKKLNISQKDKKVTILSIEVISNNETFAKFFCENIANETSKFYIETKSKKAKLNVDVLQKQVDSIRQELNGAISGVAIAIDDVYNLNPAFNTKTSNSKKKQIDVQANTAILTNLVVQLELAKINLRKETPLLQLIDGPLLPLENLKFGKLILTIFGGIIFLFLTSLYLVLIEIFKD
jgi:uncharacterized protein involved in exopolysaccharide biosynthesis